MKSLSTVAAVAVLCGLAFFLQPTSSAFAEAIKQLQTPQAMSYVSHIYRDDNSLIGDTKVLLAKDGRQRRESVGGTVTISDASSRPHITLLTKSKVAIVSEQPDQPAKGTGTQLTWLEHLRSHGDKPDEKLGQKELDGHTVEGFVVKQDKFSYTVWIDTTTRQLVQVEHGMAVKGSGISRVVMDTFQFHESLDESNFSFDVPAGYKVQKQAVLPKLAGGEQSVIEALRGFTKRSKGKFPKSITEWGEWAVLLSAENKDGKPTDEATAVLAHLGATMPFLLELKQEDYEYTGAGKSTEDKRCIVFWHKTKDGKLRAIFNDLTVAEVNKEELPK